MTGIFGLRNSHPNKRQAAVNHFLEHGPNLSRTVRAMGYPSTDTLRIWCDELVPGTCRKRSGGVKYTHEQKRDAVVALFKGMQR